MSSFSEFLEISSWSVHTLDLLCDNSLHSNGISALVLDFDGVLASTNQVEIPELIHEWLIKKVTIGFPLAIHSNNNNFLEEKRKSYMKKNYPKVLWMSSIPKKPSPTQILKFCQQWSLEPSKCAMVDDRLYTGGKAAYYARAKFIYIDQPQINYQKNLGKEAIFQGIRYGERLLQAVPSRRWCTREDSNFRPLAPEANALSN